MFPRLLSRRNLVSVILLLEIFILVVVFVAFSRKSTPPTFILEHPYFLYDLNSEESRTEGQKCVLPRLHPFHPSIWNYLPAPKPLVCKSRQPDLTSISEGILILKQSELQRTGYEIGKNLFCHWSEVKRAGEDDDHVVFGSKVPLPESGVLLPSDVEVLRVQCQNFAGFKVYEKLHARIRSTTSQQTQAPLKNPVNVIIFGIDSISRLSFIRLLPKTYKYLTEHLNMTVFRGMNKVGDNSYPNLIAMLTGHKGYGGGLPDDSNGYDKWPLVWKNYSNAGYSTLWAEDLPKFGLFNYLAKGFRQPPTDHYLRPLYLAIEGSSIIKFVSNTCYGSKAKYLLQVDYLKEFISNYNKARKPYFGFSFLSEISHDYIAPVASADEDFESFFRFLDTEGLLKNSVLFVLSDHGHRFDAIRSTEVGHIEERMPFSAIRLPASISSLDPHLITNLQSNRGRLVTPYDLHATFEDLLHYATSGRHLGTSPSSPGTLGQSLFKKVPLKRTCQDASIPDHFCTCKTESPIPVTDPRAKTAAVAILDYINGLFRARGPEVVQLCTFLTLKSIRSAYLIQTMGDDDDSNETRVRVVLEAAPSGAVLEATVTSGVLSDVSRINMYGNQSSCIQDVLLRKYCFCRDLSQKVV